MRQTNPKESPHLEKKGQLHLTGWSFHPHQCKCNAMLHVYWKFQNFQNNIPTLSAPRMAHKPVKHTKKKSQQSPKTGGGEGGKAAPQRSCIPWGSNWKPWDTKPLHCIPWDINAWKPKDTQTKQASGTGGGMGHYWDGVSMWRTCVGQGKRKHCKRQLEMPWSEVFAAMSPQNPASLPPCLWKMQIGCIFPQKIQPRDHISKCVSE